MTTINHMVKKKKKASSKVRKSSKSWGGFTKFQMIVIGAVFIVFAIFMLM